MKRITLLTLTLVLSVVPIFWISAGGMIVKEAQKLGLELIEKAKSGSIEDIKLLINKGADLNRKDDHGNTALMWACEEYYTEIAELLIEKGADLNIKYDHGNTALMWACIYDRIYLAELLIEKGAGLNIQDNHGNTALMKAFYENHTDVAELLIEKSADLNIKDNNGNTALMWVCYTGDTMIAKLLIEKGADLHKQDNNGMTALMRACSMGDTEVAKLLIENGADLNIQDNHDYTALMWVCGDGDTKVAKLLIENGADLNIQDKDGNTALILVSRNGDTETCKAILSHAIILPELQSEKVKFIVNLFLVLKKNKCPKDIQFLIASKLELMELLYFENTKDYRNLFREAFLTKVDEIAKRTIEALKPMMVNARNLEGLTQELKDLLNPQHYEDNFGQVLRENIEKAIKARKLHLFVQRITESVENSNNQENSGLISAMLSWFFK